ncbi:MAG TPA: hypothetical protein VFM57_05905 [Thermoleophilaceae bacterium]|nr:hypothetical protein [Thermoleophilaceae bacterium]
MPGRGESSPVGVLASVLILAIAVVACWPSGAAAQENAQGVNVTATAGQQFTATVAKFDSTTPEASAFQASVTWGDGSPMSAGAIVQVSCAFPDRACYEVRGTHMYASAGTRTIETRISGPDVRDSATVHSQATVNAPTQPPPPLAAVLQPKPQGGGLVVLDASGSVGPITSYHYDLDGNGSYETKCGESSATAVYGTSGPKTVGVKLIGSGGGTSTTTQTLNLGAGAANPALGSIKAIGDCGIKQLTEVLMCPSTLRFGTVEMVFPATAPAGACFAFRRLSANELLGGGFPTKQTVPAWRSPKDVWVQVNGIVLRPGKAGNHLAATASPVAMRIVGLEAGPTSGLKVPLKVGGKFSAWLLGKSVFHLNLDGDPAPLNWDVAKAGVVGTLPGVDGYLFGLPLAKTDAPLKLSSAADARLSVQLKFPVQTLDQVMKGLGITSNPIALRTTNTDGLEVAQASTSFGDIPLGILTLKDITITYSDQGGVDVWEGTMKALFLSGYELDGKLRFADGYLQGAEVFGTLPGLGIPLGCCIYLNGFGAGFNESAIEGKARFIVPPKVLDVDWLLRADTSIEFSYTDPWSVKAEGVFYLVGIEFGTADLYVWPSGGWAQGIVDHDAGPFSVEVTAQIFVGSKWYAYVSGAGCFDWIDGACITVAGAASSKAVTACGAVTKYFPLGGYFTWKGSAGIYFECGMEKVKEVAGVSQARGPRRFRVRGGLSRVLLRFRGRTGAPLVEVTAPGGRRYTSPDGSGFKTDGSGFLWVREGRDTYLMVRRPAGGTWRVEEQAGSPSIASVGQAGPLPRRPVWARVRGSGHRRVLDYRLKSVEGQSVTFFEVGGRGGPSSPIGRARGRRGSIRFTPAEGPAGPRRIDALLESSGLPRGTVTVARYRAPAPLRPARPRPAVARRGDALVVRWGRVAEARRYRISVRTTEGRGRFYDVRQRRLLVRGVPPRAGATIAVRAVSRTGLQSHWGRTRVKALPALSAPSRVSIRTLFAPGLTARCSAMADGRCELTLAAGRRTVGRGARMVGFNRTATVQIRLTRRGRKLVRAGSRLRLTASLPGEGEHTRSILVLAGKRNR